MRTLQTLAEVATEHSSTLVLPIPIDVLEAVRHHAGVSSDENMSSRTADDVAAALHP